jgi:hypothetical protein
MLLLIPDPKYIALSAGKLGGSCTIEALITESGCLFVEVRGDPLSRHFH